MLVYGLSGLPMMISLELVEKGKKRNLADTTRRGLI
jgi:hypothetical protein